MHPTILFIATHMYRICLIVVLLISGYALLPLARLLITSRGQPLAVKNCHPILPHTPSQI